MASQAHLGAARLSVLVIDDDPGVREFLDDFLRGEGFEVTTLSDPTVAIDRIRREVFHLVMLDLIMPKVTGIDLLAGIRQVDDDLPVILMTPYPSLETVEMAIRFEISAYLAYPFLISELREVIARIAKKKKLVPRREDNFHAALGRQVRTMRAARDLTLKQMARRTNLPISLLSQIERGESSASLSSLFRVATVLGVRLTDLVAGY